MMPKIKIEGRAKIHGKAAVSTPPTYLITKNKIMVLEGASVIFTLNTTKLPNGTVIPYTITGISASDITSGSLTGNFIVNNNIAITAITMTADQAIEGAETATLTLNNIPVSSSVLINDSYTNEVYYLYASPSVPENRNVSIILETVNVPTGAIIPYTITGVTSGDINNAPLKGNFIINYNADDNAFWSNLILSISPDFITEGTETLTLTLDNGLATISIQINDIFTSAPPTYSISCNSGFPVNESMDYFFIIFNATNVFNQTISYSITGITTDDIVYGNLNGNVILSDTPYYIYIYPKADYLLEGTETMTVTLGNNLASLNIPLLDTSKPVDSPEQKAGLLGWYDSTYQPINIVGVPDNNTSITTTGFPTNGSLGLITDGNGNNGYANLADGINYGIAKINNEWQYASISYFSGDEDNSSYTGPFTAVTPPIKAIVDATYPWQATWDGPTIVRNGSPTDVLAINGQTVTRWNNKASTTGAGRFSQNTLAYMPTLTSEGILFNGKFMENNLQNSTIKSILGNPNWSNTSRITYYFVLKNAASSSGTAGIINNNRLGPSNPRMTVRISGAGATSVLTPSNISVPSTPTTNISCPADGKFYIYSVTFQESSCSIYRGSNLKYENLSVGFNETFFNLYFQIGWLFNQGRLSNTTISKLLIYDGIHDDNERTSLMNYLFNNTTNSTLD